MITSLLAWTFMVGFGIPGIVTAVRTLAWVDRKAMAGVKPWACDVCMSFWTGAFLVIGAVGISGQLVTLAVAPPAYTIALLVLGLLQRPPSSTGDLPTEPPEES